ncbi:hypothetical protein BKA66DRAFT_577490 [Pyrenochaeta sp. MPI-SDFR-AT-0127]|nr:hypothetical protein BKA66DRAFT_577490 [Pyrenochaeta sp. MPI-SDFR-AT-0127]
MTSFESTNGTLNWFSKFNKFAFDPNSGLKSNFERLAAHRNWGHKLKRKRWTECQTACFDALYGGDADKNKLEKWQELCHEVHITNPPETISGCKEVLGSRKMLVNIVNLIDHRLIGVPVIRFKSYRAFHDYTTNGRTYPLKKAKEEGFIKALLRKL